MQKPDQMTMPTVEEKLAQLGLTLPPPPVPAGNYLPVRRSGNVLFLAGVLNLRDGSLTHKGAVGREQTVEAAYDAARVCALNALAAIKMATGSLDQVRQILLVSGFVNGVSGFPDSPRVINGASDLFAQVFGEAGKHARAAVAVAGLPLDATVEIQVTVEVA